MFLFLVYRRLLVDWTLLIGIGKLLGYLKHGDLERGKEEEIENIAALLVLNV